MENSILHCYTTGFLNVNHFRIQIYQHTRVVSTINRDPALLNLAQFLNKWINQDKLVQNIVVTKRRQKEEVRKTRLFSSTISTYEYTGLTYLLNLLYLIKIFSLQSGFDFVESRIINNKSVFIKIKAHSYLSGAKNKFEYDTSTITVIVNCTSFPVWSRKGNQQQNAKLVLINLLNIIGFNLFK